MRRCFRTIPAALVCAAWTLPAFGQVGTGFTYQGRLKLSGAAVNSTADFQFRLFGAATGGAQIGQTVEVGNMALADGVFTVPDLDFGAGAFTDQGRFLEIAARPPAGTGNFLILTPRQPLNATPYALKVPGPDGHSLNAADGSPGGIGGAGSAFVLRAWALSGSPEAQGLVLSSDGNATVGTTTEVTASWDTLPPDEVYIGLISHRDGEDERALTLIEVISQ